MEAPESFLEVVEQWDRQRPDIEVTPEAKRELLKRVNQVHRCRYQTTITVVRNRSITSLQSEKGDVCEDGYIEKRNIYILCNDKHGYSITYGAGIHGAVDKAPQLWVFSHSSPVPLSSTSATQFVYPIDWVFLANFSVLNVAGIGKKKAWRVVEQTPSEVVLEAELDGGAVYSAPRRFRVGLSKRHNYAPNWVEEYSPLKVEADNRVKYQSFPTIKIKVLEWRKVGDYWMPQRWERVRQIGTQTQKAVRISHIERRSITLRRLNFETGKTKMPFSLGTSVSDFRLCGTDISYGDVGSVDEDCFVSYQWDGNVPTLDRLKQIRYRQVLAQRQSSPPSFRWMLRWVQWGIPLLLIAIGFYWWWRARRS
ncbi:hypothetical protein [Fischerella thermalis]|uniref:hypothetical protein n=1 Tax=Fischerella thermalis TaxID=372787 RepID=UPI0011AF3091|nr:hypothetical protein [Fischerella thermalis]